MCNDITETFEFVKNEEKQNFLNQSYFSGAFSDNVACINEPLCPIVIQKTAHNLDGVNLNNVLSRACYSRLLNVVKTCLQKGARPNVSDKSGRTSLHSAASGGCASVMKLLLEYIPNASIEVNINQRDYKGWTPLFISVCRQNLESAKILLSAGADVHLQLSHNKPPCKTTCTHSQAIHFAAMNHHTEMVDLLIEYGAQITDRDESNRIPLHYASCVQQNYKFIKKIIQLAPETVMVEDIHKRTPLHVAASKGLNDICLLLIQYGSNPLLKDIWDITPIDLALLNGHQNTAALLCPKGETIETVLDSMEKRVLSLLITTLAEPNEDQLCRCIKRLGCEMCLELLENTLKIQENGGQVIQGGMRKRTAGGVFFYLIQQLVCDGLLKPEDWVYIKMTTREKERNARRHRTLLKKNQKTKIIT